MKNSTKNLTYFNTLLEPFLELKKAQKTLDMSQIRKTNRPSLGCTEDLYFDQETMILIYYSFLSLSHLSVPGSFFFAPFDIALTRLSLLPCLAYRKRKRQISLASTKTKRHKNAWLSIFSLSAH